MDRMVRHSWDGLTLGRRRAKVSVLRKRRQARNEGVVHSLATPELGRYV